jgi:hypothetical protein
MVTLTSDRILRNQRISPTLLLHNHQSVSLSVGPSVRHEASPLELAAKRFGFELLLRVQYFAHGDTVSAPCTSSRIHHRMYRVQPYAMLISMTDSGNTRSSSTHILRHWIISLQQLSSAVFVQTQAHVSRRPSFCARTGSCRPTTKLARCTCQAKDRIVTDFRVRWPCSNGSCEALNALSTDTS